MHEQPIESAEYKPVYNLKSQLSNRRLGVRNTEVAVEDCCQCICVWKKNRSFI